MDSKQFKKYFNIIAKDKGFEDAFGGWIKDGKECILVLVLQKSKFGDYFQLNIKIFIQGMFGKTYIKNKDLVQQEVGNVFTGEPLEYKSLFDFDKNMDDATRKQSLEDLFNTFLLPFAEKALTKAGVKELYKNNQLFLLPAVKKELGE